MLSEDGKLMLRNDIHWKQSEYDASKRMIKHLINDIGFEKDGCSIECQLIRLLTDMIVLKNDIKNLEIRILKEQEEQ